MLKIPRANRFAMIGQQFLPQLVVYGNPARGGGDQRPEAPVVCKFWRWVLFRFRINTQFHIHKTYVTTRKQICSNATVDL